MSKGAADLPLHRANYAKILSMLWLVLQERRVLRTVGFPVQRTQQAEDSMKTKANPNPSCSLCKKNRMEVLILVAAQNGVFICNECIFLCHDIMCEVAQRRLKAATTVLNKSNAKRKRAKR